MSSFPYLLIGIVLFFLVAHYAKKQRNKAPLPPGPKPLPIIGNLLDMPSESVWLTYDEWFKEFQSDIIYVNAIGKDIVILNTYEAAVDLLDKRSALYSSRVHTPMLMDLMGWSNALSLIPYGEYWKRLRRLCNETFNANSAKAFEPLETKAALKLLVRLIDQPGDVMQAFRHTTGGIILTITYGLDILPENDPFIELAEQALRDASRAVQPGAFWVDFMPWLEYVPRWMPGASFQRFAADARRVVNELIEKPFNVTKEQMSMGSYPPSLVSYSLENLNNARSNVYYDERTIKDAASVMYAAGSDTTVTALGTLVLCVIMQPDIQKKAQAEIDNVLNGSLPTFKDQEALPYVMAVVLEALRWSTVIPFGLPHQIISDDIYKGYRIPSKAMVMANIWSMFRDEEMYPDPDRFNPDRFLKDGKLNPEVRDPRLIVFGFGRRICPGRHVGFSSLWIAAALMLATMEFCKATDKYGNVIEPKAEFQRFFLRVPKDYECNIKPRSAQVEALVRAALNAE